MRSAIAILLLLSFTVFGQPTNPVAPRSFALSVDTNSILLNTNAAINLNGRSITNQAGFILLHNRMTFVGTNAGNFSASGDDNAGFGWGAGRRLTTGSFNTLVGVNAGESITTGSYNVFVGDDAGDNTTTGIENFGMGYFALGRNVDGDNNVAIGQTAMQFSTNGASCVAIGSEALEHAFSPQEVVAIGQNAMNNATNLADQCVAIGAYALEGLTNQPNNTAVGYKALWNTRGFGNTGLGAYAGQSTSNGQYTLFLGDESDGASTGLTNAVAIGPVAIVGANNSMVLGGTGGFALNVGIGTTTPIHKLHVVGDGLFSNGLEADGSGAFGSYALGVSGNTRLTGSLEFSMPFVFRDGSSGQNGLIVSATGVDVYSGSANSRATFNSSGNFAMGGTMLATNGTIYTSNAYPISAWSALGNCGCITWISNNAVFWICTNSIAGTASTNLMKAF